MTMTTSTASRTIPGRGAEDESEDSNDRRCMTSLPRGGGRLLLHGSIRRGDKDDMTIRFQLQRSFQVVRAGRGNTHDDGNGHWGTDGRGAVQSGRCSVPGILPRIA